MSLDGKSTLIYHFGLGIQLFYPRRDQQTQEGSKAALKGSSRLAIRTNDTQTNCKPDVHLPDRDLQLIAAEQCREKDSLKKGNILVP